MPTHILALVNLLKRFHILSNTAAALNVSTRVCGAGVGALAWAREGGRRPGKSTEDREATEEKAIGLLVRVSVIIILQAFVQQTLPEIIGLVIRQLLALLGGGEGRKQEILIRYILTARGRVGERWVKSMGVVSFAWQRRLLSGASSSKQNWGAARWGVQATTCRAKLQSAVTRVSREGIALHRITIRQVLDHPARINTQVNPTF